MVKLVGIGFLATWLLALSVPGLARAAAGDLDSTFGPGGKITTFFTAGGSAFALALQPDGKIVVAGGAGGQFALARYARNGNLDPTFGSGGKVTTAFSASGSASALALQPDGKIVVAGSTATSPLRTHSFVLARYTPNGSLDPTFGDGGKVTTGFSGDDFAAALALQPDGKIVVAGSTATSPLRTHSFALARYTSKGSLDPSFGEGGKIITDFGDDDFAFALALQPDGKVVAAGSTGNFLFRNNFALARYTPDGGLDPTFGTGGKVTTDFGGDTSASASAVALQPDGKIVVTGFLNNDFVVGRYTPNGSPDLTFGTGGRVTTAFGLGSAASALVIQPDGKIVAAGSSEGTRFDAGTRFALARYNPDGSLDLTFGVGGKSTTDFDHPVQGRAVALQPDGRIVVAGGPESYFNNNFALARYNANGSPDLTFRGNGGKVTTPFVGAAFAHAVALQPDGKIVVTGSASRSQNDAIALARYRPDGSLDPAFGTGGTVLTDFGVDVYASAFALALQFDGKIVVAGATSTVAPDRSNPALVRYTPDGSLDVSFGAGGKVTADFAGSGVAAALALQPDGKIVVGGGVSPSGDHNFALARYDANGSPDLTFGAGGKIISGSDFAPALVLQPDGKIVVVGGGSPSGPNFTLARYNADGSLDPTFGSGGRVTTGDDSAFALALQPDGKIIVLAREGDYFSSDKAIYVLGRYTPDGSPDLTFGTGGKVITVFSGDDFASALALQPDGKIVVTGRAARHFALARYNPDGALDLTFGAGGKVATDFDQVDTAAALVVQPDGRIVVAGQTSGGGVRFALARYTGDLPTTAIAANQLGYRAGDLMTVAITTDPGLATDRWYVIVALETPQSTSGNPFFVYRYDPVVGLLTFAEASARPIADITARPLGLIPSEPFTILQLTLPPLPAGSYRWLTTLISEDLGRTSNVATAAFEISP